MNRIQIKDMSTTERLQVMEALWDSLLQEEIEIDSPEWHQDILSNRKKKIEDGKAIFVSLKKLKSKQKS